VERVFPIAPPNKAAVGARPVFELGYEAPGETSPRELRFRITLDRARPDARDYAFDQRKQRSGWAPGAPGRMLYRPARPLRDGVYRWSAWFWNGAEWVGGDDRFELRVDSVPPAPIADLRVSRGPDGGPVILEWSPVTLDQQGRPEYVARYHVYRHERPAIVPGVRRLEIGVVEQPRFVDPDPPAEPRLLYYTVAAEDDAGNESGRRD
jgi:hypothetical protein